MSSEKRNEGSSTILVNGPPSDQTQYYASVFTRRRLCSVVFLPPFLTLLIPATLSNLVRCFDYITGEHTVLTLSITFLICREIYKGVQRYAPTQEKRQLALEKCRYRLELAVMLFIVCFVRLMLALGSHFARNLFGEEWSGFEWMTDLSISFSLVGLVPSWIHFYRVALGTLFLSCMVTMRFIGIGIAQCSSFPLPSNPVIGMLKSPDSVLDRLTGPDTSVLSPQQLNSKPTTKLISKKCTRFQTPTFSNIAIQVMFHAVGGFFYFVATATSDQTAMTMACCIILSIATLFTTYSINAPSHELTVRNQMNHNSKLQQVQKEFVSNFSQSKILFIWLLTPILLSTMMMVTNKKQDEDINTTHLLWREIIIVLLSSTYPKTLFLMAYTVILDILVRMILVVNGMDVDRLLCAQTINYNNDRKVSVEEEFSAGDLIVQSILAGLGTAIVEAVIAPRAIDRNSSQVGDIPVFIGSIDMDLEEEESRWNNSMIDRVANLIEIGMASAFTSLKDDLLRMMLLESLGGVDVCNGGSDDVAMKGIKNLPVIQPQQGRMTVETLGLSSRHYNTLKKRLQEPDVVPIVRALCAYAGGVGEALIRCTASLPVVSNTNWSFSPCTSASVEYAIFGATRLVALSLMPNSTGQFKKHYNRLSLLVPAVLQSVYKLHCGLVAYAQYVMDVNGNLHQNQNQKAVDVTNKVGNYVLITYPDIGSVLNACDATATTLMLVTESAPLQNRNISVECRDWLRNRSHKK